MVTELSLLRQQKSASGSYSYPDQSSPRTQTISKIAILI